MVVPVDPLCGADHAFDHAVLLRAVNQTSSMSRVKFYAFAQAGNAAILLGSNSFPLVHTAQATRNNLRAKITMDSVVLNRSRSFSAFALLKAMRVNRPLGARMLAGQIR